MKYRNLLIFIIILLSFGAFYPFVHNYVLFGRLKTIVSILALTVWTLLAFSKKNGIIKLPHKSFNIIVFILFTYILIWGSILSSPSILKQSIDIFLGWYFVFLMINTIGLKYFINAFTKINIVSLILGLIGLLLFFKGVLSLYSVHEYQYNKYIYNFLFFFVKRTEVIDSYLRIGCYYDEPGSLAYVVMFLLLINRKYFLNIKREYSLLILPLISTSLAHIITASIFILFFNVNLKLTKQILQLTLLLFIVLIVFNYVQSTEFGYFFKSRTTGRIERLMSGERDKGREGGLELGPEIFKKHYLGISPESISTKYPGFVSDTFWGPLLNYGVFGIFIFYLPFIYLFVKAIRNREKLNLLALFIVMINLLQRPIYTFPLYILLIYILFFCDNKIIKQQQKISLNTI